MEWFCLIYWAGQKRSPTPVSASSPFAFSSEWESKLREENALRADWAWREGCFSWLWSFLLLWVNGAGTAQCSADKREDKDKQSQPVNSCSSFLPAHEETRWAAEEKRREKTSPHQSINPIQSNKFNWKWIWLLNWWIDLIGLIELTEWTNQLTWAALSLSFLCWRKERRESESIEFVNGARLASQPTATAEQPSCSLTLHSLVVLISLHSHFTKTNNSIHSVIKK